MLCPKDQPYAIGNNNKIHTFGTFGDAIESQENPAYILRSCDLHQAQFVWPRPLQQALIQILFEYCINILHNGEDLSISVIFT